jgi:ABC-type multidrug transport system permease subunit
MRYVWATAVKDLRRRLRDPLALVLWLGIPFAILLLLSLAFGGGETTPQARLLIADEDSSLVSGLLASALGQGPMAELIQIEKVTLEEGRRRIGEGDGSALLLIPPEFGSAVLNSRPTRLELLTNPSQSILPGILEEVLSLLTDAVFYLQRLAGEPLSTFSAGPADGAGTFPDQLIAATSVQMNQLIGGVTGYLFPPRIAVAVEVEEPEGQKNLNFGALFFNSMFFLAILFMAQGMSDDFWVEKRQGTLQRALTTPHSVTRLLAGKLLAAFVLLLVMALLGITAGALIYDFPAAKIVPAALWAAASGLALLVLFTLLQLFATSQKAGGLLSTLLLFPLMMAGGSFFPFEAMPNWLAAIGRKLPNGWALEQFKLILGGGTTASGLLWAAAGLLAALVVGSWLAGRRLRGGFLAR